MIQHQSFFFSLRFQKKRAKKPRLFSQKNNKSSVEKAKKAKKAKEKFASLTSLEVRRICICASSEKSASQPIAASKESSR